MKTSSVLKKYLIIIVILISLPVGYYFQKQIFQYKKTNKPNVVIISVDTLRADHLGAYGYKKGVSPNIDKLAEQSTLFTNAVSPIPWTIASHASIFTGQYPIKHQVFTKKLDKQTSTLAEILGEEQYKTSAFVSSMNLTGEFNGLNKGFDLYNNPDNKDALDDPDNVYEFKWETNSPKFKNINQRAERTYNEAANWLEENHTNNFFLFTHFFDPHAYYDSPKPFKGRYSDTLKEGVNWQKLDDPEYQRKIFTYEQEISDKELEYLIAKYDEEIAYTDYYIGELLNKIEQLGEKDNTIIIITADHGESFEGNYLNHGKRLYESSTKIPLLIYDPANKKSSIVKEPVSLIDLAPTIIDRLKIKMTYLMDGTSLNKLIAGDVKRDAVYSMSLPVLKNVSDDFSIKMKHIGQLYSVTTKDKKLIYNENNGNSELYNLSIDPNEKKNIYTSSEGEELFSRIINWIGKNKSTEYEQLEIKNRELYDTLKSLGYL